MIQKDDFARFNTVIRASTPTDFSELQRLLSEYEESLPGELRHGAVPEARELSRKYEDLDAAFIGRADDRAAACVVIDRLSASLAAIRRLYVRPAFRRRGLARALVLSACEFARSAGYERIALDTDKETLPDAYALYRSLGFTACAPFAAVPYANATFLELRLR